MKTKSPQKTVYNIVVVVILVLALSLISIITYVTNKNSDKLSVVVTNLSENKYEIDKIDEAIQLLYRAENDSRLYVLTRDETLYTDYMNQLNRVSALIVSIQKDDEMRIDGLVKDKKYKTELYINAKLLADSLMRERKVVADDNKAPVKPVPRIEEKPVSEPVSTKIVEEYVVEKKSKKGLFGRIKDAIANKPNEKEHKSITTIESPIPSSEKEEDEVVDQPIAPVVQSRNEPTFARLTEKEKDLLLANGVLFEELKSLLGDLKQQELDIQNQRQAELGNNAALLMTDLKTNNQYNLILSLLLTVVILSILVLLYRNMQALQRATLKAEQYAKYKSDFIATLSHEIRTPLHSIHAFTDELLKKKPKDGESEVIDAIKLSSNMLISIVNNILDFTKMENGKFKLNHLPFIPSGIIQEVIMGLTIQAKRKGLILTSKLEHSADEKIYGDAFQFRQLLINLINNAIKYTETGSVTVDANFRAHDEYTGTLEVIIEDTGIGIAENRLPQVFEEYNSQNSQSEIKEGSTGLGLSIVKRIVDYHKGEIEVRSEVGKGTSFRIKIPYDIFLEKDVQTGIQKVSSAFRRILIVENDPLNLKILKLLFVNENYKVSHAVDGIKAFELYKNEEFDILITDISMPGLNGFELARKIRELKDARKASVPIIAITGFESPKGFHEAESMDINDWLVKPFNTDVLLEKVEELCKEQYQEF